MNKYLEKIAAISKKNADLIELEPGVFYNKASHSVEVSKEKNKEVDSTTKTITVASGAPGLMILGGGGGLLAGESLAKKFITNKHPNFPKYLKGFHAGGALVGGALGLGAATVLYEPNPTAYKWGRQSFVADMEKKHAKKIDDIEGWNY